MNPLHVKILLNRICSVLQTPAVRYADNFKDDQLSTVAVWRWQRGEPRPGSTQSRSPGPYITADIKYHDYFDTGMVLVDAGHYETEVPIVAHMARQISRKFPDLVIHPTETVTNPMQVQHRCKKLSTENPTISTPPHERNITESRQPPVYRLTY